ncbi:MAG: DUF1460 domain-containing protein [Saprospiraceae bacterium]
MFIYKTTIFFLGVALCLGFMSISGGQGIQDPLDRLIFEEKMRLLDSLPMDANALVSLAQSFEGTPYVAGCLERQGEEQLVVNLRALDCWTFVEQVLALQLAHSGAGNREENYLSALQNMRYWGGQIEGYASRHHYFTGWLLQGEKRGHMQLLTEEMGGKPFVKTISFMSMHPDRYPALANKEILAQIKRVEARLSSHSWFYIPKNEIASMEHLIQEGDLIAITSYKNGLDIAHEGFALRKNGRIHLLHASSLQKQVVVGRLPLAEYLKSQRGQSGIMVARWLKSE